MTVEYCLALLKMRQSKLRDHRKQRESEGALKKRIRGGGTRRNGT